MPYKSDKQRRFFHTQTAKDKGITPKVVNEFDQASKGMKLPESASDIEGSPSEERSETRQQEMAEKKTRMTHMLKG